MVLPVAIGAVIGGIATSLTAVLKFADNPLTAYLLVLSLILVDAGIGLTLNYQGVFGSLFTLIINSFGIPIVIMSWQTLIFYAFMPFILYAFKQ